MVSAISVDVIAELRYHLGQRQIGKGMARLDEISESRGLDSGITPSLLCYVAQWVDAGWRDAELVVRALALFPKGQRTSLSLSDYICILMAEGMVWVSEERVDRALENFQRVISMGEEVADLQLLSLAHFWSARCHRKSGEYDAAMMHTAEAYRLAMEADMKPMAAAMQVTESWLLFQKGRTREALKLLSEAELVLSKTDDYLTRGNIQSSYGRMYRREGRYELGIRHFGIAITEYTRRDPEHRNLARTLTNMGYVERLIALQHRKRIDADAAQRRRSEPELRRDYEDLRSRALAHLDRAAEIYRIHSNHRGAGTVCINRGHLHLDSGDLQRAEDEAREACRLGEEKKDYILMAQADAAGDELEEEIEDPAWIAHLALEAANAAVEFSSHTENRRLQALSLVWHGLTLCNTSPQGATANRETARDLSERAAALLRNEVQDHIWEDLQVLKGRVVGSGNVDARLQAWSQGVVGQRSFQQLTEDFADIVIPRVWEQEERKVARVARRLAISPKKVRRVLARLGLHSPQ